MSAKRHDVVGVKTGRCTDNATVLTGILVAFKYFGSQRSRRIAVVFWVPAVQRRRTINDTWVRAVFNHGSALLLGNWDVECVHDLVKKRVNLV